MNITNVIDCIIQVGKRKSSVGPLLNEGEEMLTRFDKITYEDASYMLMICMYIMSGLAASQNRCLPTDVAYTLVGEMCRMVESVMGPPITDAIGSSVIELTESIIDDMKLDSEENMTVH